VSLTDARPPSEVAAEFAAAQAGESLRDRRRHEARTQAETTLAQAEAQAAALVDAARAEADRKLVTARAQTRRFLSVLEESQRSPSLTRRRIFLDAMHELIGGVRRRIILPPGDAVDLTVLGLDD
jgi:membrane protease subunit HflK